MGAASGNTSGFRPYMGMNQGYGRKGLVVECCANSVMVSKADPLVTG